MASLDGLIDEAINLLKKSQYAVVLTGAGVSTPSGIPDYRSPDSGLWEQVQDPMEVASLQAFKRHPQAFYDWVRPLVKVVLGAQPNAAHAALSQLEAYGPLQAVITQNIDMLHTRAGSETVLEMHGHMRELTCVRCFSVYNAQMFLPEFLETGEMPRCPDCGGVLKPNVILYGELLPVRVLNQAQREIRDCDLILVAGSSLEVSPVGDMPLTAKHSGAKLIIVNFTETHLDYIADVVIHADVAQVLPQLAAPFIPEAEE